MSFIKGHKINLGKHPSEETIKKLSAANMGKHHSEETRNTMSEAAKNRKPMSEETKRRMSVTRTGKHFSEEHKKNLSASRLGNKAISGENSRFWRGGVSFEPYAPDWTLTLKRSIRERDNYVCRVCGELQRDETFAVHHIDYDKKNCSPDNLVTLCLGCHRKTGFNREYWSNRFKGNVG